MKTHSTTSRYKILVLMDKSKASSKILKDAVKFAKIIEGSIDIFQVEPPTNVVKYDNQITIMRDIDEERFKQEMVLKEIVSSIKNEEGLPVICNFTFGNVKNEIKNHIEKTKPDIVVLGKRKKKVVGLLGDQITEDIINSFTGSVLISGNTKGLSSFENQSIGFFNTIDGIEKIALVNDLKEHTKKPLKFFKTLSDEELRSKKEVLEKMKEQELKKNAIVYEFDANNNNGTEMASFISKNNLALLCVHKNVDENSSLKGKLAKIITKTIEKINVPVLVLNNNLN
jgi:nucleotide-binding universal stress UspA family protein